ncbi:putative RNA polymerase Rpb3/Rpb11 dimerisation domain-containing protein [Neospora caninum Liverpool]|uniref:Putative RNA polymerase Rpb3/Rpb11 dimerisation domain-containing protein n=1 Tax=Neospora caninum (strain Liverpool) TaxID=572307 RepID=F0VNC6_NEOCL|nr:putative RNA polymerase Rpb3/Rpb11 dimerisation domain-containing protein [Neospora caninum Liverpool]CBZ55222.1 putative RNA polymerase Rpb3/Rpb11 dimerisation domain-containing protein [Neospora caninum Liverpool]|eukprot:XP_003885250.1 putative RNA polymerase Rpb3/Rpb11 dimerisation domain-containing protein [Neospora caninum Liverpool]
MFASFLVNAWEVEVERGTDACRPARCIDRVGAETAVGVSSVSSALFQNPAVALSHSSRVSTLTSLFSYRVSALLRPSPLSPAALSPFSPLSPLLRRSSPRPQLPAPASFLGAFLASPEPGFPSRSSSRLSVSPRYGDAGLEDEEAPINFYTDAPRSDAAPSRTPSEHDSTASPPSPDAPPSSESYSPASVFATNELAMYYAAARLRGDTPPLPGEPAAAPFPSAPPKAERQPGKRKSRASSSASSSSFSSSPAAAVEARAGETGLDDAQAAAQALTPTTLYNRGPRFPHVELHPKNLTGAPASLLSKDEQQYLWRHGYFAADHVNQTETWKNWHLLNRGRWTDPGVEKLPNITTLRGVEEPPFHRVPLQFWDEARGLSHDVRHYPIYEEFYNSTTLDPTIYTPRYNLTLLPFTPAYVPRRDRMGLQYGDARIFDTWPSWDKEFTLRVEEATNVTVIPETGHLYQKLYIGPIPVTTGWTMGSLIKAFAAQRCPGHAVVALKLHAPPQAAKKGARKGRLKTREKRSEAHMHGAVASEGEGEPGGGDGEQTQPMVTKLPSVREDILEIALNLKGVAFETLAPRESACIRVKVVGPQLLVAGMIGWPSFVRVANPEHFIAKVEEGGVLDLEIKLEWGRGAWLADLHGLYREEEGVDTRCYKRRRIWEVDNRGFYPTSCVFGACTMMRLAVHKLMGTRFCQDRQVSTNPTEQLVVEIWTDASKSPKEVLAFALQDMLAWLLDLRRQLVQDVDWKTEDEDLNASWKHVAAWTEAKALQDRLGGPPLMVWEDPSQGLKLAEGEKSFAMPEFRPPPCPVHPVSWLKRELARSPYPADGYSDSSKPRKKAGRRRKKIQDDDDAETPEAGEKETEATGTRACPGNLHTQESSAEPALEEGKPVSTTTEKRARQAKTQERRAKRGPSEVLLASISGLPPKALHSLHEFGLATLADVRDYTPQQLRKIPHVGSATVALLESLLSQHSDASPC